jgi:hypothetical protein
MKNVRYTQEEIDIIIDIMKNFTGTVKAKCEECAKILNRDVKSIENKWFHHIKDIAGECFRVQDNNSVAINSKNTGFVMLNKAVESPKTNIISINNITIEHINNEVIITLGEKYKNCNITIKTK